MKDFRTETGEQNKNIKITDVENLDNK